MKNVTTKLTLAASVLAIACAFTLPVANAQPSDAEKAAKKKAKQEEMLKKYDKNKNGKLDADEEAEMKADQAKAKEAKKKKDGNE